MTDRITLQPVRSRKDLTAFIHLPRTLYRDDPNWVMPLETEVRIRLDPHRNPYFQHARAAYFLAYQNERVVGRISAQVCELTQLHQGQGTGHFGFFESIDSQACADALFQAAEEWLREQGMTRMVGPFNLSINEEAGLLIEGFHRPPFVFMCHNPPYYQALFDAAGMAKQIDVYAYLLDIVRSYPERLQRIMRAARRDSRIRLRSIRKENIEKELTQVLHLFNEAWSENWGHVPMTQAEVKDLAMLVRRVFSTDAVLLAEIDGECVGFIVAIANLNELTADFNGRLFPTNWLKLLYRIRKNKNQTVRVPLMGIARKYQHTRTAASIALSLIDRCRAECLQKGVTHCELSWILESNLAMRSILEALESELDKTYRLYARPISQRPQ